MGNARNRGGRPREGLGRLRSTVPRPSRVLMIGVARGFAVLLGPRQHPSPESLPPLAHGKDFPAFVRALLGHAPAG